MLTFGKKLLFIDGAMGTMLGETAGVPEMLCLEDPDRIRRIHKSYVESGADIITTNTFGANRLKLSGTGRSVEEVVKRAVEIAREAAESHAAVTLDIGPTGALLRPMGTLPFEEAYEIFAEVVRAGKGADMISIETMTDTYELKAAVLAAKENADLPVLATVSIDAQGRLLTGANLASVVALLEGLGVDALGLNCGLGPVQFKAFFEELCAITSIPIALLPNAGLPEMRDGETRYDLTPAEFAEHMRYFAENGAHILGGCCGTTPEHIRLMTEACRGITPVPLSEKNRTVVCGYGNAVVIDRAPVIIGERINPTGKKRFKEALKAGDLDYILAEGISQEEAGAHILDVNVGLPGIDEGEMMERVVVGLQGVLSLPLQIDTGDAGVMERAARLYNGKPLFNSVNGKAENMHAVFPVVKKYGGAVVALTLDENGIPTSAEDRVKIADKIIRTAAEYGIPKHDILMDALTMAVSAGEGSAAETLKAVRTVRNVLGVHTVLGVSNISFGLPDRETVNSAFFALALENGLSAGIINPKSEAMMGVYDAFCVLRGLDADCARYVGKYGQKQISSTPASQTETSLYEMIVRGLRGGAYGAAKKMLETVKPMELVESVMIPALDTVGRGFEQGTVFLPQLLSSAETVKEAFEAVKESTVGENDVRKGKIILATVRGDIHDIGKNIVKLLLENYGFGVVDLGRDVPPEEIVKAAMEEKADIVGLSALMTTTVGSMEESVRQLEAAGFSGKTMVGGAVLTEEYAKAIGADFYAHDALSGVAYARQIVG
ncbi:MAG: homocysteine methyltransferase [Ruminococcaceae bacterium]|nr:homocysteine methyltransferase [Oscillospiraceae bacterium]